MATNFDPELNTAFSEINPDIARHPERYKQRDSIGEIHIRVDIVMPDGSTVSTRGPVRPPNPQTSKEEDLGKNP